MRDRDVSSSDAGVTSSYASYYDNVVKRGMDENVPFPFHWMDFGSCSPVGDEVDSAYSSLLASCQENMSETEEMFQTRIMGTAVPVFGRSS